MYLLKSLNPRTGFIREFELDVGKPVIIGTLPVDKILRGMREIFKKVPDDLKRQIYDDVDSASRSITMQECKISHQYISRAHFMVFPGDQGEIMDLGSTNGTKIAGPGGGTRLDPGRRKSLKPGDIIILANGLAIFHYLKAPPAEGPVNADEDEMDDGLFSDGDMEELESSPDSSGIPGE